MIEAKQPVQVPAPLADLTCEWKNSNEPEWICRFKGQRIEGCRHGFGVLERTNSGYNVAAAGCAFFRASRNRVPIDQRQGHARIVERDPGPAARFGGVNHGASVYLIFLWRETGGAGQFL